MSETDIQIALLRDPRIAAHALAATPVWLWRADGTRVLWANPAGFSALQVADSRALATHSVDHSVAVQIARSAAMLHYSSPPRLERLRGLSHRIGQPLTCFCSRISLPDLGPALLVVAAEPVGPSLSGAQRLRKLLAGFTTPVAAFSPDGQLRLATPDAATRLDGASSLDELGVMALGEEALRKGSACGAAKTGMLYLDRVGGESDCTLLLTFGAAAGTAPLRPKDVLRQDTDSPGVQTPSPAPSVATAMERSETDAERRYPLRFIWQTDASGRFTLGSNEFTEVVGPHVAAALGRPWSDIAAELGLDPKGEVATAIGTRNTWSGITVPWPADDLDERLPVELSGLPVFDGSRAFAGYRGFGVCRDLPRLTQLARARRSGNAAPAARLADMPLGEIDPPPETAPDDDIVASTVNVVPFPTSESRAPMLTQVEHHAFHELARQLSDRLQNAERAARRERVADEHDDELSSDAAFEREEDQSRLGSINDHAANTPDAEQHEASGRDRPVLPEMQPLLDHLPTGVLISRYERPIYANAAFLAWSGFETLDALHAAGGLEALHVEPDENARDDDPTLTLTSGQAGGRPAAGRLLTLPWNGEDAHALVLLPDPAEPSSAKEDIARWKKTEQDLIEARSEAEKASAAKSAFLAKISHEVRTPMNAIIGFSEMIMAERFGPVGNERYLAYLKDIHASGEHVVSLLNDLLDLSKIEAGKMELTFTSVGLNDLMQQCVAIMQPQANREQIIIRTALSSKLPQIVADARSVRQIVLNLLSNSIKFTDAGGQVIVSSALNDNGQVVMRVRDTGAGMSKEDIVTAMEPFRQLTTSARWGSGGTGLGLPLTKALAEANHAAFNITSAANTGTLVEVTFPADKIPAE